MESGGGVSVGRPACEVCRVTLFYSVQMPAAPLGILGDKLEDRHSSAK